MSAFHAYDIRGLWEKDVTTELAYKVGRAYARFCSAPTVLVGHDARLHSHELYQKVIDGLRDEGTNVVGIGLASTPQMHFYQMREKCRGGIMVTASHNPKEYHGFKLFDAAGGSVSYEKGLNVIERMIGSPFPDANKKRGVFIEKKLSGEYIDFIIEKAYKGKISKTVVIDAANGSAGKIFKTLVERLRLKAVLINGEPDGNFPNHDPNPLKEESRKQIREKVRETKAAFGVLLDGDGDRIIFIDENGEAVENYFMSALIAEELLKDNPGASVVYDLISSKALPERIVELGGKPVVSRVGYTFVYDKMVENKAIFGAETSGHVYFKVDDLYYTESAAFAFVLVVSLLKRRGKPLSELIKPLRSRYFQAGELNLKTADKEKTLTLIREHFRDGDISLLDGVSVSYDDYWFNVRPSNTEPLIRVRLEAKNEELALRKIRELGELLEMS